MGEHRILVDVLGTRVDRNYTFQQFKVKGAGGGHSKHHSKVESKGESTEGLKTAVIVLGSAIFFILVFFSAFFVRRKRQNLIQKKGDCEKEAIQSEAVAIRQDQPFHPQEALNTDNRPVSKGALLGFKPVAEEHGTFIVMSSFTLRIRINILYRDITISVGECTYNTNKPSYGRPA